MINKLTHYLFLDTMIFYDYYYNHIHLDLDILEDLKVDLYHIYLVLWWC